MRNPLETLENRRLLATFAVTSAADSGAGTLRDAITQANATPAADLIQFNIAGANKKIGLASVLPSITNPLTIDATTQPGYAGSPLVELSDASITANSYGLVIGAASTVIRGLAITAFSSATSGDGDGIFVQSGVTDALVEKCYLGLRPDGSVSGNEAGAYVATNARATIRTSVVSGNSTFGIWVDGNGVVESSRIGTDPSGMIDRGNGSNGVHITGDGQSTVIGGDLPALGNVISGNNASGIYIKAPATKVKVGENIIGANANSTAILSNSFAAVRIDGAQYNFIGYGTQNNANVAAGNTIAGTGIQLLNGATVNRITFNSLGMVEYTGVNTAQVKLGGSTGMSFESSDFNFIWSNHIGNWSTGIRLVDSDRNQFTNNGIGRRWFETSEVAACATGIAIWSGDDNMLGDVDDENHIANNTVAGIWMTGGQRNRALHNVWQDNAGLDIDLGSLGYDANDGVADSDTGPNALINHPVLSSATATFAMATVTGKLELPAGYYRVDYFQSSRKHPDGEGEGLKQLDAEYVTIAGSNGVNFTHHLNANTTDTYFLSAIVTRIDPTTGDKLETSEFSKAIQIAGVAAVLGGAFAIEPKQSVSLRFSQDVSASLNPGDITLKNKSTGQMFEPNQVNWVGATKTATWTFNQILPDGNYEATLDDNSVGTPSSTLHWSGKVSDFFLAGDVNRDRTVNFDDLLVIAQNYGKSGKTFSQGNVNYDAQGKVDFDDLLLLAQRYGTSLFSASPIGASPTKSRSSDLDLIA